MIIFIKVIYDFIIITFIFTVLTVLTVQNKNIMFRMLYNGLIYEYKKKFIGQ